MNRQRLFRGLRIAWSVAFGILCLLLIGLWARSYSTLHWGYCPALGGNLLHVQIAKGWGMIFVRHDTNPWQVGTLPLSVLRDGVEFRSPVAGSHNPPISTTLIIFDPVPRGSGASPSGVNRIAILPLWTAVLLCSILATVPWLRWRFSLRTLLIVVTVVAVVLGLGVYFVRK